MLKPLSEKTLRRKYDEAGLSQDKIDLLHKYFNCFSNLYGCILLKDAWEVFRHYEGLGYIRKKEFVAFSGITQREVQSYKILDMKEVYSAEENCTEMDRFIVNDFLIGVNYYKFRALWDLEDTKTNTRYFTPEKEEFFKFETEQLWANAKGRELKNFIENLRSGGTKVNPRTGNRELITDLDGNSVKNKYLKDFKMFTSEEAFFIDYEKRDSFKKKLIEEYSISAADKVLWYIKRFIQVGSFTGSPAQDLQYVFEVLDKDFGVMMTQKDAERFIRLYMEFSNSSNRWSTCGWKPAELRTSRGGGIPTAMTFGPGMQKAFADGTLDREEIAAKLKGMGIEPVF